MRRPSASLLRRNLPFRSAAWLDAERNSLRECGSRLRLAHLDDREHVLAPVTGGV